MRLGAGSAAGLTSVGLTEEAAQAEGVPYRTTRSDFADLGPAQLRGETAGFARLLFHEETGGMGPTVLIHPRLSEAIGAVTTTAPRTGGEEACCG